MSGPPGRFHDAHHPARVRDEAATAGPPRARHERFFSGRFADHPAESEFRHLGTRPKKQDRMTDNLP